MDNPTPEAVDKALKYDFRLVPQATVYDGSEGCVRIVELTPREGKDREAQRVRIVMFSDGRWHYSGPPWKRSHDNFYREAVTLALGDVFAPPPGPAETAGDFRGEAEVVTPDPPGAYCPVCAGERVWRQHYHEGRWAWRTECEAHIRNNCIWHGEAWFD